MAEPLSRRQIVDIAKQLVLADGPSNVLEFGGEILEKYGYPVKYGRENCAAIQAEAFKQADRVYAFLGYVPRS